MARKGLLVLAAANLDGAPVLLRAVMRTISCEMF